MGRGLRITAISVNALLLVFTAFVVFGVAMEATLDIPALIGIIVIAAIALFNLWAFLQIGGKDREERMLEAEIRKADMSTTELREFKWRFVKLVIINALLFGFVGALSLINGWWITALIWFTGSVGWLSLYFWHKRTPYIRITKDEIVVFPSMVRRSKLYKWDTIQNFNRVSQNKIELILSGNKLAKIPLLGLEKKDRESFIQILEAVIGGKK